MQTTVFCAARAAFDVDIAVLFLRNLFAQSVKSGRIAQPDWVTELLSACEQRAGSA